MKLQLKRSVKEAVDQVITEYHADDIEYIELGAYEYIQFLEEIVPTSRIILSLPERRYRGVNIRVKAE